MRRINHTVETVARSEAILDAADKAGTTRPRDTCPTCKRPHTLSAYQIRHGHQCDDCRRRDEGYGFET